MKQHILLQAAHIPGFELSVLPRRQFILLLEDYLQLFVKTIDEDISRLRGINDSTDFSARRVPSLLKFYWLSPYDETHPPPFTLELTESTIEMAKSCLALNMKASGQLQLYLTQITYQIQSKLEPLHRDLRYGFSLPKFLKHMGAVKLTQKWVYKTWLQQTSSTLPICLAKVKIFSHILMKCPLNTEESPYFLQLPVQTRKVLTTLKRENMKGTPIVLESIIRVCSKRIFGLLRRFFLKKNSETASYSVDFVRIKEKNQGLFWTGKNFYCPVSWREDYCRWEAWQLDKIWRFVEL